MSGRGGGDVRQNRQYAGAGGSHCRGPPRSSSSHLSALCLASLFSFHSPSRAHPAPCFSGYSGDSVFLFFIIIVFVAQHILTLYGEVQQVQFPALTEAQRFGAAALRDFLLYKHIGRMPGAQSKERKIRKQVCCDV